MLTRHVAAGDAAALYQMALWHLIGSPLLRDLAKALRCWRERAKPGMVIGPDGSPTTTPVGKPLHSGADVRYLANFMTGQELRPYRDERDLHPASRIGRRSR